MYVAVKGGERAIEKAHELLADYRRGDTNTDELSVAQIQTQLPLAVARVMSEGSLYDPHLAALAIKQSAGELLEAIFLLRAYRTTLSRFGDSLPLDTEEMSLTRRISAVYKDVPGGQLLGPTFDYTHRLLDFTLLAETTADNQEPVTTNKPSAVIPRADPDKESCPHILDLLSQEGLMTESKFSNNDGVIPDVTREPMQYPSNRAQRLQLLARADEGFLLALAYSGQRGYGRTHPFLGELRIGEVMLWLCPEELGFDIPLGEIEITECEMLNQFVKTKDDDVKFTRGYGLSFGYNERKSMTMALVDRALCAEEWNEEIISPAQQEEFVLAHCDSVESSGFVSHLKLPHYVDFQSELELIRQIRSTQQKNETKTASKNAGDITTSEEGKKYE